MSPEDADLRQTHSRKLGRERRLVTFIVLSVDFGILWVLLVPMFSYEPQDSGVDILPGTELSHP